MSLTPIDKYMISSKMRLKNSNHCLSFVSTLFRGEVILCTFNNISRRLVDIFSAQTIEKDDREELEFIINTFVSEG